MSSDNISPTITNIQTIMDQFYLTIAIAILLVVITFLISRKLKKPPNVVLLVGLSESGKTAIFSKMIFNKPKKSVTSLKENEASIGDLNLKLIDLPGAERLRSRYWDQYCDKARHIIFVVDSTTVDIKLRNLADYLYELLAVKKQGISFTIACHKQDLDLAKDKNTIRGILDNELNAIRNTKKGQLGRTSELEEVDNLKSHPDKQLSLDKLKVDFIETSLNNLDQLIKRIL